LADPQTEEGWGASLLRAARDLVVIVGFVVVVRTLVVAPFYVPSASMEPTLLIGDELLTTKFPYGYSRYSLPLDPGPGVSGRVLGKLPERGDVVVFKLPRDPAQTLVKRVIGLPGDRLQMREGRLWINDRIVPIREAGIGEIETDDGLKGMAARYVETLPNGREHIIIKLTNNGLLDDTPVYVVPPDHLFMMGDNRDNSLDSRVPADHDGVGYVPVENLIGRVDRVLGSWDFPIATRGPIWDWPSELRLSRFFGGVK
jgi:signal peptidase I